MAKLYFYYSAMNAGKSTTLLQSSYNYQERGMQTLLFKPLIDNRSDVQHITSRIGLQALATCFDECFDFFPAISQALLDSVGALRCVLIDEAQFLTKAQVAQLGSVADELNLPVLCYGIRSDFRGELFPGSQYLLAWADELIELKTICHCGRKATMNMRVDENNQQLTEGEQVEIGGNERYIATCRRHFRAGITQSQHTISNQVNRALTQLHTQSD